MASRTATARRAASRQPESEPAPTVSESALERRWLVGVTAVAALVLASGWSSNIQFGDSAESVAGVESLGILHAPGYPAYALAAKAFTIVWPFGGAATQVHLFSIAASLAAVALAFRCGRLLSADRPGAAVGALSLATGLSFWYYASYAKAYALTTLLLLGILCLLLIWKERGGWVSLVAAGAVLGFASGASYQVVLLAVPGLALLVFGPGRRPSVRLAAAGLGAAGLMIAVVLGYVLVRSSQDPAVSWGGAHDLGRLIDLLRMRDFGFGSKGSGSARLALDGSGAGSSGAGSSGGESGGGGGLTSLIKPRSVLRLPVRILGYPLWVLRDLGPLLAPLAAVGAVASWRRGSTGRLCLTVMLLGNLAGASLILGGGSLAIRVPDASRIVSLGGFMLTAMVVVSLWVGLGATALLAWARNDGGGRLSAAERRRRQRSGRSTERVPAPIVVGCLAGALLATAALNGTYASHRTPAYARDYATNVFASLPEDAVILTWVAERSFALEEQQIVEDRRTDIDIVRLEQINQPWYREQINDRLGTSLPLRAESNQLLEGAALAQALRVDRPVFLDHAALYYVSRAAPEIGFRQRGLVAEVVDGEGRQEPDLETMDRLFGGELVLRGFDHPGADRWPNDDMLLAYAYALVDYGSALANADRFADAAEQFEQALVIDPGNETAQVNLDSARARVAEGG